jgi:2-dehydro-3-deoxyphosphogluconate aldolase/(4S)-4-hydroxy-2-oxoglutarate aldolase
MNTSDILNRIETSKIVAVVRLDHPKDLYPTIDALLDGGVNLIEATMTIPGLLDHVPDLVARYGSQMVFGVGSVLNAKMADDVIRAGAQFVVSPIFKQEIIDAAKAADRAVSVGAYTPTEIFAAWEGGSDIVKVFPGDTLGPAYIKGVRAPMPFLKLMPTGGVSLANVPEWLKAGVVAMGIGSALVDVKAVKEGRFDIIRDNAAALAKAVATFYHS